jgi:hypothetical protein
VDFDEALMGVRSFVAYTGRSEFWVLAKSVLSSRLWIRVFQYQSSSLVR